MFAFWGTLGVCFLLQRCQTKLDRGIQARGLASDWVKTNGQWSERDVRRDEK